MNYADISFLIQKAAKIYDLTDNENILNELDSIMFKGISNLKEDDLNIQECVQDFYLSCIVKNEVFNLIIDKTKYTIRTYGELIKALTENGLIQSLTH